MNLQKRRNRLSLILIILGLITVFVSANAKTIYIAPTGKSSSGSPATSYTDPVGWDKLGSSMPTSFVQSGDTIYFLGGVYNVTSKFTIVQGGSSGTESKRTYIGSYPGETAIFDGRNQNYSIPAIQISGNYVHCEGMEFRYSGKNGLLISGSNCIIENCKAYGNGDTGIQVKEGGSNNVIKNCDSYDNFNYKDNPIGGNADGFADKQHTSNGGNTYINCRAWGNSDDGWDFFQHVSNGLPTQIKDSWCFDNGPAQYDMTDHPRYAKDKDFFDTYLDASTGKIIVPNSGNGNGFKLGGKSTKHDITLTNCVAFDNKIKGFDQNNNGGSMIIYNCTSYNNGTNYGLGNKITGAALTIKNCVSAGNGGTNFFSGTNQTNNTWNLGIVASTKDFASVDTSVAKAKRNADGSLSNSMKDLFQLSSSSKLLEKGTDVGLTFCHTAPDLGAFEFCGTIETGGGEESVLLISENFQNWTAEGTSNTDCEAVSEWGGTTTPVKYPVNILSSEGGKVNISLANYAVNPTCGPKKPTSQPEYVSDGYIALNKNVAYLEIASIPYVSTIEFTQSATGTGTRGTYLSYSTDNGATWTNVVDDLLVGTNNLQGGNLFSESIDKNNVMIRITPNANIIRIHDLKVYGSMKGNSIDAPNQNDGFQLSYSNDELTSSEEATLLIYDATGLLIKEKRASNSISLQSLPSGIYLGKAIDAKGRMVSKKIAK